MLTPIKAIRRSRLKEKNFTIISNNCWGGRVYQYYNLPYLSPTVGMYFFADEYIKFLNNLSYYLSCDMKFCKTEDSKYYDEIKKTDTQPIIGLLDDVEIVMLHYKSEEEAFEKWNRRKKRIRFENLIVKFNDQNLCTPMHIKKFDNLKYDNKICFCSKRYNEFKSIIWFKKYKNDFFVKNDVKHWRRYFNFTQYINERFK